MKTRRRTESTQTQRSAAEPELRFALDQGRSLFNQLQGRTAPDFDLTAGFTPDQELAFDLIRDRAVGGSPVLDAATGAVSDIAGSGIGALTPNAAIDFLTPTARGDFLDFSNNPAFLRGTDAIRDRVNSFFGGAGAGGSFDNRAAVAEGVGQFGADLFAQERANQLGAARSLADIFQNDVGNQFRNASARLSASGLAPSINAAGFAGLEPLLAIGGAQQAQRQRELDEAQFRYNFPFESAIAAQNQLNAGVGGLGPLLGGTTTGVTEETTSPGLFNSILGGGLLAASFLGGPATAAAGAGAGGFSPGGFNPLWFSGGGGF